MNATSLRILSQIRLYSAIYPRGDAADITEAIDSIWPIEWDQLPVLSRIDIPLKRLPGVNPLRYQSAISLMLSARLGQPFETIVQIICERAGSEVPQLSVGNVGWITLTWETRSLYETLDRIFAEDLPMSLNPLIPFCLWQTHARCRSIRSQHKLLDLKSNDLDLDQPMPESAQALLEALIHLLDRLEDPLRPLMGKALQREIHQICQCFDQVHGQMPIFNPHLSESDCYLFYRLLGWLQALLARCSHIEMHS
ncbi:MAG: hypothetical protein LH631_03610 [Alkalinema sp. CAN_BIN05]|nr:hypothetical protein [Alkalinema sp. CAN_BIN05]